MKTTTTIKTLMAIVLFVATAAVPTRAGSISEAQARAKAQSFLQSRHAVQGGKRLSPTRTPGSLRSATTGQPALYVFNVGNDDGFVIVSGDDRARPILGYTDSGTFDADRVPAALSEMLAIYARQMDMFHQTDAKADSVASVRKAPRRISGTMADVAPLLTTIWDQGDPYNAYCPTLNDQTALTGCVATAMAQIVYYHRYPTTQVPSLAAYVSATNKINVSAWGATTFDFGNMLDSYSATYTDTQKTAVATLMRYCGQAAQMDYGFTSGAYNGDALYALQEKLGYNANATFKSAANYSTDGWEDLIYKEVSQQRPVYYSALNGNEEGPQCGGHAFVIDGYRADGNYFHVNWGWGGACDGWFNLFALDSSAPESAPTATGWHFQMKAIVGLSPATVNTAKLVKDASGSWLITSTDDWNELSANLEAYSGGSFKLTQDISVSKMVGTESVPFSGTFDGQGHTLNVSIESGDEYAAPFHWAIGCTFKNLTVAGTINVTNHFAGGLIGWADEVTLQGCESKVTINSSFEGDGTHGGFISIVRGGTAHFYDCVFSGAIIGERTYCCGGFCGWRDGGVEVYNCLNIGRMELESRDGSATFSRNGASPVNSYYVSSFAGYVEDNQGTAVTTEQLASGSITQALQAGSREWTTGMVWGQKVGTDATPLLTSDASKGIFKVSFTVEGQVVKTIFSNSPLGEKMPTSDDFGLTNASFTCNGAAFTGMTTFSSDITVTVTGTAAYTLTLATPANGTISVNNNACIPGLLKKVTATPANGYVVSAVTVTDATGKALPVTQVSNNANEFVFAFPKSSVTVNAEFVAGEAEATRFINGGMTLPLWNDQPWTADTWTIWSNEYSPTLGTPPADALGHQWYEEAYMLTNSDADVQPNGDKIVWENHTAPFGRDRNYDYARACGGNDGPNNFYMRRVFTFNTATVPEKLYLRCNYDDAPVQIYINGTLIYNNVAQDAGSYTAELTPAQIALIHTDGTPNVLAARGSQGDGDYYLDCGLYDPTAISYEVTGDETVRVLRNEFIMGDVVIPETMTANGKTYTVTELANDVFNDLHHGITSVSLPQTLTSLGNNAFRSCNGLEWVKSYLPVYQEGWLMAAPAAATAYELPVGYSSIWNNAFKFTDKLTTLTLPRSLTYIGYNAFVGCSALTDIYAYARPVPATDGNAFEGIDKSKITVHVYASALDSYKQSWGEDFNYVTMPDPQPIALTINVTERGTLRTLINEAATTQGSTIYDVVGITVTGDINQDDLWTLSQMCTGVFALGTIDLGAASIEDNYIGNNMFRDREKLTSVILPETLEYINEASFNNCHSLTAIDIPASVKRIWSHAFSYCDKLTTVTGCEGLSASDSYAAWDVFYATAVTEPVYGGSVFLYMPPTMTGDYEMPAAIKMTTADSFRGSQLSSVTLPASLTILGDDTFRDCPNLVDIYCYATTPPECASGVWELGFDRSACTVHVPASAVEDYKNANEWRDMGRIVGIVTGELVDMTLNVPTAGTLNDELFNAAVTEADISDKTLIRNLAVTGNINANDVAYLNTLPNTLYNMELLDLSGSTLDGNAITERMFYATLYKAVSLPDGVTSIANEAFLDSRRLREVTLPETLSSIGSYAFARSGLTSITIPDGVTEIGDRGVQFCSSLTTVTIGNGVTTIPDCWAEECCNLEELTIGKKVTLIQWRSFCGSSLKNVYCYAKMPPSFGPDVPHGEINSEAVLHVYSNSLKRYQNAGRWQDFPTIVGDLGTYPTFELTVSVEVMGGFSEALATAMTAAGCEDMIDISKLTVAGNMNQDDLNYLRDNVGACLNKLDLGAVTLDRNGFYGDNTLAGGGFEQLILPSTLERLDGWHILENCTNLKTIHIPASLKNIRPRFLYGATSLETVTGGDGVIEMEGGNGQYFANCPSLKSPVILNQFFFRLPVTTEGAYEVPDHVTAIARDGMSGVTGLTALTLSENVSHINGYAFDGNENLKDVYFHAVELPSTDREAFVNFDRSACTLHVYEEMVEVFQNDELWAAFNIVGDLGTMPVVTPMNEADYAALCAISSTLGGDSWHNKWMTGKNVQTASRWRGVTFDAEGYVTAIDLSDNGLSGDISSLTLTGLTKLQSLNLSSNTLSGNIVAFAAQLPAGCTINVERQELGYQGEHTLYELCNYGGLPSIAYWRSDAHTLASTLIGVNGVCQFYHEGTGGGNYWDCYIHADGGTVNNNTFYWPSPATLECYYPHHFTFTYSYEMGDANMDDGLNVLDLQSTLNYSNGQSSGLFNAYAADTYGQDGDINVQDIVATVNILLAQDAAAGTRSSVSRVGSGLPAATSSTDAEACVTVENGQIVLYTTVPVAALDLRLSGIAPEALTWLTEAMGFATATTAQGGNTHAIVYSLLPRQIEEGRTVLATFEADRYKVSPYTIVLSDSKARPVSVGHSVPTGILQVGDGTTGTERVLYDLQGRKLNSRQQKGLYIENGKKIVIK